MKIELGKEKGDDLSQILVLTISDHGFKGHEPIIKNSFVSEEGLTKYLLQLLKEIPTLELAFEPTLNIFGFSTSKMSAEELVGELRKSLWDLSIFNHRVRIVVMPHFTKEMVDKFIKVLKEILT